MKFPKHMLCIKKGKIIIRPIAKFVTSEPHLDDGVVGPIQAIPQLETGESFIYNREGKTIILGGREAGEHIFIDGGKNS